MNNLNSSEINEEVQRAAERRRKAEQEEMAAQEQAAALESGAGQAPFEALKRFVEDVDRLANGQ
jgi:hypothetical protein